jgi:hypothetical protein
VVMEHSGYPWRVQVENICFWCNIPQPFSLCEFLPPPQNPPQKMISIQSSSSCLPPPPRSPPGTPADRHVLHATYNTDERLVLVSSSTPGCSSPASLYSLPDPNEYLGGIEDDRVADPIFLGTIPLNSTCSAFHTPPSPSSSPPSPSSSSLLLGYSTPDGPKIAITKLHVSSSHLLGIANDTDVSPFKISLIATKRLGVERDDFVTCIGKQPPHPPTPPPSRASPPSRSHAYHFSPRPPLLPLPPLPPPPFQLLNPTLPR